MNIQTLLDRLTNLPRNLIINGGFRWWQRGTTFSTPASNTYTADRWAHIYDGTIGTFAISNQGFTLGQTDVPNLPLGTYLRWNHTVAASGSTYHILEQRVEAVETASNGKVAVSFWAKFDSTRILQVRLQQHFGTGGSPSASVNTTAVALSVSSIWKRYTVTFDVPSVAGKSKGTGRNDRLALQFLLPVNTTFTFDVTQVWMNQGPVVFDNQIWDASRYQEQLQLCQRYYEKTYDVDTNPGTVTFVGSVTHPHVGTLGSGGLKGGSWNMAVDKRVIPTVHAYSPATGTIDQIRLNSTNLDTAANYSGVGTKNITVTSFAGGNYNNSSYQCIADAEIY